MIMNYSISIIPVSEKQFSIIGIKVNFQFLDLIDILSKQKSVIDIPLLNYWFKLRWASSNPKTLMKTSKNIIESSS